MKKSGVGTSSVIIPRMLTGRALAASSTVRTRTCSARVRTGLAEGPAWAHATAPKSDRPKIEKNDRTTCFAVGNNIIRVLARDTVVPSPVADCLASPTAGRSPALQLLLPSPLQAGIGSTR